MLRPGPLPGPPGPPGFPGAAELCLAANRGLSFGKNIMKEPSRISKTVIMILKRLFISGNYAVLVNNVDSVEILLYPELSVYKFLNALV
jgi:hypothetical protein